MMKTVFKIILFASVVLFMAGCKMLHPATQRFSDTVAQDSTNVQVTERYVPVYLPGDTLTIYQQLECPDVIRMKNTPRPAMASVIKPAPVKHNVPRPFRTSVSGKRSSGVIELDSLGRLQMIFNCDAWRDSVKVRDVEISRLKSSATMDSTVVTVQVRFIPKPYKAAMWFSWIVIASVLLYLGFKIAKLYFNPL